MQNKKQIIPLAALHFLLGTALLVLTVISIVEIIDVWDYMDAFSIFVTFATLIGTFFVFSVASFALGAYFMNMGTEKQMHTAIRYSVSGWGIMFIAVLATFIYVLVEYQFVFEYFLSVLLTLLPLIITGVLYKKRDAYGNDLNTAKIMSIFYFMYLGLFNTIYKVARGTIGSGAVNIIVFVLSAVMGLTITLSICYFYFKLEGKAVRDGAPAAYGQQQFGQQPYQQNPYGPQAPVAPQAPVPPVQQAPVQPQVPATKFCPACGSQMPAESGFCTNCGNKLQ